MRFRVVVANDGNSVGILKKLWDQYNFLFINQFLLNKYINDP